MSGWVGAGGRGSVVGCSIGLDYHNIEWFSLETNRDHSVIFEIASKYFFNAMALIYCGRYVTHRKK